MQVSSDYGYHTLVRVGDSRRFGKIPVIRGASEPEKCSGLKAYPKPDFYQYRIFPSNEFLLDRRKGMV